MASRIRLAQRPVGKLLGDRRGATVSLFALAMPVLIGAAGLGVEVGAWYAQKRQLQTAADAAAIAGAFARLSGKQGGISAAAVADARKNGFDPTIPNSITVNNPPGSGAKAGDSSAVEAILSAPQKPIFSALFLNSGPTLTARAVAHVKLTGQACVLSLDPAASGGVTVQGSTIANFANCTVAANSSNASAITVTGNGALNAYSLWTAGGVGSGGSNSLTLTKPAVTYAWQLADPYASATVGGFTGCNMTNASFKNVTTTIQPGVYCGGIDFGAKANVTMAPGIYILNQGGLSINAQATVRGSAVTIILTSSGAASQIGTVTINGGANVTLSAPPSTIPGNEGLLIYQDRRASTSGNNKLNGGSTMSLAGAIYFPQQEVQFSGNNGTTSPKCTEIVARIVTFIGNSHIEDTGCAAAGVKPITIVGVRLAE
jgi:hypothetical protein